MTSIAVRLKDALWSLRRRYGMESDIDRIIPFLVFERELTQDQLESLFTTYSRHTPEDFKSALIIRIQQIVRHYWQYNRVHEGYHKVLKGIRFLENVVRFGFEGCRLIHTHSVGYQIELKPEHPKKK